VYLASMRRCSVTGIDINPHGVRNAERLAAARGVADRVAFYAIDASRGLPFGDETFDAVISNDALCHVANRLAVLREWARLLRPGGRFLFTDAMVITGLVSSEELATRSSIGTYFFLPPGENERLVAEAGFALVSATDLTDAAAVTAHRWRHARESHEQALIEREGAANFSGLQRFLECVERLSIDRRLSRYAYLGEKRLPT
jgi:SAM-dependent methyltransferase